MRVLIRSLGLVVLLSCVEDGTKEMGQTCWEEADCVDGFVCDAGSCGFEDGTRTRGESCVGFLDCTTDLDCVNGVCAEFAAGGGGGDDDDGGGGGGGGTILCNDGTRSPSCTSCTSGCCSGHGGCS